jgi:hypothetical protein
MAPVDERLLAVVDSIGNKRVLAGRIVVQAYVVNPRRLFHQQSMASLSSGQVSGPATLLTSGDWYEPLSQSSTPNKGL